MTVVTKLTDFSLADSTGFIKLQRDALALEGTLSLFDFATTYVFADGTGLASGDTLNNLALNGASAAVVSDFLGDASAERGLPLTTAGGRLDLDSNFNLLNIPASTSFIIQVWLTKGATENAGYNAIIGHAFQTGGYHQWSLHQVNGGDNFMIQVGGGVEQITQVVSGALITAEPMLITIMFADTASGYDVGIYLGSSLTKTGSLAAGFNDPTVGNPGTVPAIGYMVGFSDDWLGTVHRAHIATVESDFDVAAYIESDIAQNSERFSTT